MIELDASVARFFFSAGALPAELLAVTRFSYTEELSRLFRCEVELLSDDPSIAFDDIAGQLGTFTMKRGDEDILVHGVVSDFRQEGRTQTHNFYRAVLLPRLYMLSLNFGSHLYQRATLREILFEVLDRNGFVETIDFRFEFLDESLFAPREYCVQYRENDFAFLCRMMEEEGISFFFEHDTERDTVVITDDQSKFPVITGESAITYNDTGGFSVGGTEVVRSFTCHQQMIPQLVLLKDYNPETPDVDLFVASELNGTAVGDTGLYYDCGGEHYKEPAEGERLAKIRHQELVCRRRVMEGQSTSMGLRAGHKVEVTDHFRASFNATYLLLSITHEGSQLEAFPFLISGLGPTEVTYKNTFRCIEQAIIFRPERKTPRPEISGVIPVRSDRKDEPYANLDEEGRYRTRLLFDLEEWEPMEGSLPIRKSQIYSGEDYGVHFASHKDKDMLLTCINGNPNRPVIAGEMPNPTQVTPVTQANQWQNVIRTWGKNELTFDDKQGEENILMKATKDHTVQVTNDESFSVGNNQSISVGHNRTKTITNDETNHIKNNRTITVDGTHTEKVKKDTKIEILEGTYNHDVKANTAHYHVQGALTEDYDDKQETTVTKEIVIKSETGHIHVTGKTNVQVAAESTHVHVTAATEIKLTTGASELHMKSDGSIVLSGKNISIIGSADVKVSAPKVEITGTEEVMAGVGAQNVTLNTTKVVAGGAAITSAAVGVHEITGAMVKIN